MESDSFPNIQIERKSDTQAKLIVKANIERDQAGYIHSASKALLEQGCIHQLFDLSGSGVIDSAGVGMLIGLHAHLKSKKGSLKLTNINPGVMRVFQISKVDAILDIN